MSYCGPRWIGPYHYRALIGQPLLDPRAPGRARAEAARLGRRRILPELDLPRPGPVELESPLLRHRTFPLQRLVLVSELMRGGQFERLAVQRLPTRPGDVGAVVPDVVVEVRNGQDMLIDRVRLRRMPLFASGCGCGHGGFEPEPGYRVGIGRSRAARPG